MKSRSLALFLALTLVIVVSTGAQAQNARIHPALDKRLKSLSPGERLAVIVELNEQARPAEVIGRMPGADRRTRARAVADVLRGVASKRQGPLKAYLAKQEALGVAARVVSFWIFNGFAVTAAEPLIRELAARPDVREIRLDGRIPLPSLFRANGSDAAMLTEWNIEKIRAPEVWGLNAAYNGTGAVVGSFDTGVDLTHPDLFSRYRGNHRISWFDPYQEHSEPYDAHGHGTHTTGTAVGGDASGSNIGVAPGAVWIAAKAWNDDGMGLASAFHEIFEWFLAPGGDPDEAPDVVNCSWAFEESGCDAEFLADIEAWRAAGIFPAFAAGNDGPDPASVRSPGAYPSSFAVGATDVSDGVADFSAQGPTPCDGSIKPDVCAPGDGIISAVPGGYDIMSGTSMAAPHITGAVAVLRSIDPGLTVEQLESALTAGAKDLGAPGQDNASGAGRLDLFVSAQIAILGPNVPVVRIEATKPEAAEPGPTSGLFTVSRTGNTDPDLEVRFSIGGSATMGSDFEPIPGSVTIPAGQTSTEIAIAAVDDPLAELPETVILTISPDPSYIVSGSNTAVVTIQSDELLSDLTVTSLSVPAAGGAGQSVVITETTRNQGAGASSPSVTQFYLSANSAHDGTDVLLGARSVEGLAAGAVSSGSTAVTIPEATVAGSWYIIAEADGEGTVTEISESNNALARSIKIGPDLDITALSGPAIADRGQSFAVTDTTKNLGGGPAGPFRTQIYLSTDANLDASDGLLGGRSIDGLAAGASSSGSADITIPEGTATGTWYLIAQADGLGTVAEISESNNAFAKSVKIGPDLAVTAVTAPSTAGAGQAFTVADTTKNQGGGSSDPCSTQFFLSADSVLGASDAWLGSRSIDGLAAGASSSGSTTILIPDGTSVGSWYILAKADGEGAVAETSEANNIYPKSISVGPDLVVSAISAPTVSGAGESITLSDTTKNQGGGAADATLTRFYGSTNTTLDASDTLLGSRSIGGLAAGGSSSGSLTVTIPVGTSVGTLYVLGRADAEGAVTETLEGNNTFARSLKIGPDLVVAAISAPSLAGAGQSIDVTDTTKNQGGGATGPFRTHMFLSTNTALDASDTYLGAREVVGLAAGASDSGPSAVTIPPGTASGTWYLIAKADGDGAVAETAETNNAYPRTIIIGPDLDITALSAPSTAAAGLSIAVSDTTKNIGGGSASPSRTRYYLSKDGSLDASDSPLGSRSVAELAAGAGSSGSLVVMIPQGTAVGTWYIIAKADGDGTVVESTENNNTFLRAIKII